jgi:hypothetical protein
MYVKRWVPILQIHFVKKLNNIYQKWELKLELPYWVIIVLKEKH